VSTTSEHEYYKWKKRFVPHHLGDSLKARRRAKQMLRKCKVLPLFAFALLFIVSGIAAKEAGAQVSDADSEGAISSNSAQDIAAPLAMSMHSQALPDLRAHSDSAGVPDAGPPLPNVPTRSGQGWHFSVSPYVWLPGVHGTIGVLENDASVHASFSDIFSNFSFALMGAFDPRYNRFVMPLDFMWIKLSNDKALPFDILATSAKVKVNLDVLTQKIGYRVLETERFKVDALAGVRYWHSGTTIDLESPILTNTHFYGAADWVDGVGGARIQVTLMPKLVLTIAGDAGGGGANSDYQFGGLLGWKLKKIILQAGYRYLAVNYQPGTSILDVTISGLILGATIPLK
jgi:hypothetical protein